jgi:hypothetical protein
MPPPSPYVAAQSNPRVVFLLQGGTKRPIPDPETLAYILRQTGQVVQTIPDARLAQYPTGAPVPSRRDGILYRGPDASTEQMRGGERRRIPDATTRRGLGLWDHRPLPISDADRAAIPAGSPIPSASWFAQPPRAPVPVALLPFRIETRFGHGEGNQPELWVRIFPDTAHVDSFEPELTADETAARQAYLADPRATSTDADQRRAAWARLARRFGSARAAWIVSPAAGTSGTKSSDWTRAARTAVLPDRFIVCAYDDRGNVIRQSGAEIADGLVLGPSPGGGDPAGDEGLRWMRDFQRAVELGLGVRVPISTQQAYAGFARVLVLGVKSRLDPSAAAVRLGDALDAHHYTDGIELLRHGTPTNNSETTKSGYHSDDPGYAQSFAVERGEPRCPSADGRGDGDRLAHAFGVAATRLAFVRGAEGRHDDAPSAMNTLLWPATLGYYLGQLVPGAVADPANTLPAVRSHFITWVRARGAWPTLRLGRQPYGIVPVVWSAGYQPLEGGPLSSRLLTVLQALRPIWRASASQLERVGRGNDPDVTLAAVLGMCPSSMSYAGRSVLGPQWNQFYWRFLGRAVGSSWWTRLGQLSTAAVGSLADTLKSTRLGNATYLPAHFQLASNVVIWQLSDIPLADNYLRAFAGMGFTQLRDAAPPPRPVPLLWLLARHAALRQYADSAYELLGAAVSPPDRLEPELIDVSPTVHTPRVWDHLALALPNGNAVGIYLDQHKSDGPAPFVEFWHALDSLAEMSTVDLDTALRETLDLCSHRLDAWYTSLASQRLDFVRQQAGNQLTIYLGAYGWVDDVRPQPVATSFGYVHAPSLGHAATAAVLRSGYVTHQTSESTACAIDLSSARVRQAQQLLDGVRAGQPVGTLLGYQLERALHERSLDAYISHFREFKPMEGVAGDCVVDGLSLLDARATIPWGTQHFPPLGDTAQVALDAELSRLADTLDALSDLMLAESVHQLVGGNPLRAGATVDAIGRGDSPPPVLDVTRTPRRGAVITYRLLALLPDGLASGWPSTPRGRAEPRLDAFVAGLLGPPERVRVRAQVVSPDNAVVATIELTLADLGLGPLDVVALPDRAPGPAGQSEIEQRIARVAWSRRPAGTPDGSRVVLMLERDSSWAPEQLSIDELLTAACSARALIASSRGATGTDLALPDQSADPAIDRSELQSRADAAAAALASARARFGDGTAVDVALDGATLFGIRGAIPLLDSSSWQTQAERTRVELDTRFARLAALEVGFSRSTAAPTAARDHDVARLRVIFGEGFSVVPCLTAAASGILPTLFAGSDALLQNRPLDAVTWLSRCARVRPGASRLEDAMLYAEALNSGARLELSVAQLPQQSNDVWAALPLPPSTRPADRLSVVALGAPATSHAALFIDEWLETVPNATETTGVTFHVDDPKSRAPQAIILAVQPDDFPEWTLESVEGTLLDAVELAQLRAVDPDALGSIGHFLPALLFATNLGGDAPDAITTDLTLATRPPIVRPPVPTPQPPIFG